MSTAANYILLDAARMADEIDKALELNKSGKTLFSGKSEHILVSVSPYLFNYKPETDFSKWHSENGWGNSWAYMFYVTMILKACTNIFENLF